MDSNKGRFLYTNAGGFLGEAARISFSTRLPGSRARRRVKHQRQEAKSSLAEARDHILDVARVIRREFYLIKRPAQRLGVRLVG